MFGTLGGQELFVILVIALIVFGPKKLPEIGKSLGRMLAEFRKASTEFKQTIENEIEAEKLREMVQPPQIEAPPPAIGAPHLDAASHPTEPAATTVPRQTPAPSSETPAPPSETK